MRFLGDTRTVAHQLLNYLAWFSRKYGLRHKGLSPCLVRMCYVVLGKEYGKPKITNAHS